MPDMASEKEFADYLDSHGFTYERKYHVGPGEFDFKINTHSGPIYCDVKEIHNSDVQSIEGIDAHVHLRGDIRKLRKKYKSRKLDGPVVLTTMNYSSNYFTGLTVSTALIGNVGITFDRKSLKATQPLHHVPKGDAVFTRNQNTSISGVFVFDRACGRHVYFKNPYAAMQIPNDICPSFRAVALSKAAVGQELIDLGNMMFLNTDFRSTS